MIKKAEIKDLSLLANMAVKMWQDSSALELEEEFKEIIHNDNAVVFIKFVDEKPIGFAQCSYKFHMAAGFTEANRIICFKKHI